MTSPFSQYPKRDFSPYAIDGCDVRCESRHVSKSTLLVNSPAESYDFKDEEKSHQYEDPAALSDQVRVLQGSERKPRRRYNDMYEPHIPLKNLNHMRKSTDSECSVSSDTYVRESCMNRCLLFFVLLTSVTALILVVLMMLGSVGQNQCSCSTTEQGKTRETVESPRSDRVSSDEPSMNDLPPDVQLLDDKIKQLRGNISLIKATLVTLQQDITHTKSEISTTKQMINNTRKDLSVLQEETQDSLFETQTNISGQLGVALSKTNDSFHSKLAAVQTVFVSKLNNTEQNLLDADDSLRNILGTINSSLSAQIQSISKLQGPTGPPGFNGSEGDQGPKGSQGLQGDTGDQGSQGPRGDQGQPGRNCTVGPTGDKGDTGPKGSKGEQGDQGGDGAQGLTGAQGPQGAGNFSTCQYHDDFSQSTAGPQASTDVYIDEPQNMRILGVTCSTEGFEEYNLIVSREANGLRFKCECKGQSQHFRTDSAIARCYIHFWQCPLTT